MKIYSIDWFTVSSSYSEITFNIIIEFLQFNESFPVRSFSRLLEQIKRQDDHDVVLDCFVTEIDMNGLLLICYKFLTSNFVWWVRSVIKINIVSRLSDIR